MPLIRRETRRKGRGLGGWGRPMIQWNASKEIQSVYVNLNGRLGWKLFQKKQTNKH